METIVNDYKASWVSNGVKHVMIVVDGTTVKEIVEQVKKYQNVSEIVITPGI
jgi:S-methylmethionine-dependent homocysteine/selenocysteine methylase